MIKGGCQGFHNLGVVTKNALTHIFDQFHQIFAGVRKVCLASQSEDIYRVVGNTPAL